MEPDAKQLIEIRARAAELLNLHGTKAYGRARMQLYEALHRQDTAEVESLTHVCLLLMWTPPRSDGTV